MKSLFSILLIFDCSEDLTFGAKAFAGSLLKPTLAVEAVYLMQAKVFTHVAQVSQGISPRLVSFGWFANFLVIH